MSNDLPPSELTDAELDQASLTTPIPLGVTRRIFAFGAGVAGMLAASPWQIALAKEGKDLFPRLPGEKKGPQPNIHKPSKPLPTHKPSKSPSPGVH